MATMVAKAHEKLPLLANIQELCVRRRLFRVSNEHIAEKGASVRVCTSPTECPVNRRALQRAKRTKSSKKVAVAACPVFRENTLMKE
jgi:hypothetical protein